MKGIGTAFFITTSRCTKDCPFCFYSTGYIDHPVSEMDAARMLDALDRLAAMGVRKLIITGGEPLLRGDIIAAVGKAGELGFERLLLTNGELLDERLIRNLADCGIEGISLSVNSFREAERLERCATLLQSAPNINVSVTVVFSKTNSRDLSKIYGWARSKGWGVIFQPAFVPGGPEAFNTLSPHSMSDENWKTVVPLLDKWGATQGAAKYVQYILSLYGRGKLKPRRCFMGKEAFVLDCDGSIYPCFHRRDLKAGSIFDISTVNLVAKLADFAQMVGKASCYGEHCVSLFYGQ